MIWHFHLVNSPLLTITFSHFLFFIIYLFILLLWHSVLLSLWISSTKPWSLLDSSYPFVHRLSSMSLLPKVRNRRSYQMQYVNIYMLKKKVKNPEMWFSAYSVIVLTQTCLTASCIICDRLACTYLFLSSSIRFSPRITHCI